MLYQTGVMGGIPFLRKMRMNEFFSNILRYNFDLKPNSVHNAAFCENHRTKNLGKNITNYYYSTPVKSVLKMTTGREKLDFYNI